MKFTRMLLGICLALCFAPAVLAAAFEVTKTADTNDGVCNEDCSLREAVAAANASPEDDLITFLPSLFGTPQTITLVGTDIIITNNGALTITGPGADKLTVSGNGGRRIFTNNSGAVTTIRRMRLTGGNGVSSIQTGRGGAVYNSGGNLTLSALILTGNSSVNGGATNNAGSGTMTIINSVISNNTVTGAGGGMQNFSGSTLHLINTSVIDNTSNSTLIGGGGIQANGTLTMSNVTFSGNNANGGDGGAIYYNGQGLAMNNVTVTNNTASGGGSGGLHKQTSTLNANVRNSIFSGNTGGDSPDVLGTVNSQGSNIVTVVGASAGWIASDLLSINPLLAPLGFYGGFGPTHALLTGSPAINAGHNCVTDLTCAVGNPPVPLTTDQRGASRVGTVDIGAYEVNGLFVASLPNAFLGQNYRTLISANPGDFTYFVSSGSLPPGLTLNSDGGVVISGTPTQSGFYLFDVTLTNGTNMTVVSYQLTATSNQATATVRGRVFNQYGRGLMNAVVVLADPNGERLVTRTNSFGYFTFSNVPTGITYTVGVTAKNNLFAPQFVTVKGDIDNLNFVALPPQEQNR